MASDSDVGACRLQDVVNGTLPADSPLVRVATDFLPTVALAAKLGVPAGGVDSAATAAELVRVRAAGADSPGWWRAALVPLESVPGGAGTTIAQETWRARDAAGFALYEMPPGQSGDWHMFNASVRVNGYGQYARQAENGGRFFGTAAMLWEARGGRYAAMAGDFARVVGAVDAIGAQLASGDTSHPLLEHDRGFLSLPSEDETVRALCESARASFPNKTDAWGARLCAYYQDAAFGLPENGIFFLSFVKGLLDARFAADGSLALLGSVSPPWVPGAAPWHVSVQTPPEWPDVASFTLRGLSVRAIKVDIFCTADAESVVCDVSPQAY
jgi:hypothetical protein